MSSWIRARDGQVQTSPWLNAYRTRPSTALSRKASSAAITSLKKMLGLLPPSSVLRGVLHDQASGDGLAGEGDLGDALVGRQRLPDLGARSGDNVDQPRWDDVADHLHQLHDRPRCGGRRLQ